MQLSLTHKKAKWLLLIIGLVPAIAWAARVAPAADEVLEEPTASLDQLKGLCIHRLQELFGQAEAGAFPVGYTRGHILLLTDPRHARAKAKVAGAFWRGKRFEEDGSFVNQWPGFRALHSEVGPGTSWFDGRPCSAIHYPPGTPLFANMRDELREIAPGLWLCLLWEREPCPRLRGIFALQLEADKARKFRR